MAPLSVAEVADRLGVCRAAVRAALAGRCKRWPTFARDVGAFRLGSGRTAPWRIPEAALGGGGATLQRLFPKSQGAPAGVISGVPVMSLARVWRVSPRTLYYAGQRHRLLRQVLPDSATRAAWVYGFAPADVAVLARVVRRGARGECDA